MSILETMQEVPLVVMPDGTIRIADSRVSLDSVVYHYCHGATVEEIALRFPGLGLADIHSCVAYYLNHQAEVDHYLIEREEAAAASHDRIVSDPQQQMGVSAMRQRIAARQSERRKTP
jgi:uncharacterized protein (DUF433 family)